MPACYALGTPGGCSISLLWQICWGVICSSRSRSRRGVHVVRPAVSCLPWLKLRLLVRDYRRQSYTVLGLSCRQILCLLSTTS